MLFILFLMILSAYGSPVLHGTNSGSVKMKGLQRVVHNPGKYPYLVHLKIVIKPRSSGTDEVFQTCGGVLIKSDMVLTAGHCVLCLTSKPKITVTAGAVHLTAEKNAQTRQVKEIEIHEIYKKFKVEKGYEGLYPEDDLAMLWLNMPFSLGKLVKLAKIPQPGTNVNKKVGVVVGWGLTESGSKPELLKEGRLRVVANEICSKAYHYYFTNKAICILADDLKITPCEGDSGGPFVVNGVVEGIISFGTPKEMACETGKLITSCDAQSPAIVTRVEAYLQWIYYRVRNGSPNERRELEHVQNVIGPQKTSTKKPGQKKICDKKTKKCIIL